MEKDFACCRLIFGDADGNAGLTVTATMMTCLWLKRCYGMDVVKPVIFKALTEQLRLMGVTVRGIYERNDVSVRELDGMERYKGWYRALSAGTGQCAYDYR